MTTRFRYSATFDICTERGIRKSIAFASSRSVEDGRLGLTVARKLRRKEQVKTQTLKRFFCLFDNDGFTDELASVKTP